MYTIQFHPTDRVIHLSRPNKTVNFRPPVEFPLNPAHRLLRCPLFYPQVAQIEAAKAAGEAISVKLPDGSVKPGVKGVTTPLDIAQSISAGLAKKAIVAVVNGEEWDLFRPLIGDCSIKICTFEDPEGKDVSVIWGGNMGLLVYMRAS